jgi:hypothetical protein
MKRIFTLAGVLAALASAGVASADPGQTPHGDIGACNGMTPSNAGMNNAVNHLLALPQSHGLNGMIISIGNTSPYGQPPFCP